MIVMVHAANPVRGVDGACNVVYGCHDSKPGVCAEVMGCLQYDACTTPFCGV